MTKKTKYPLVLTSEAEKAVKSGKGKLKEMSPKAFLGAARPLRIGDGDRKLIDNFKDVIKNRGALGPLKLYADGKEDGRHRANASKELGLDKVPVIDYRKGRKRGGQVWDLLKRSAGEMAEMVEPGSTTRKTPSLREVAEGMLPRDPYEVVGEAQKKFEEGDKLGAAEEMLGGIPETGALRFKGPARPLDTPRSVEEAIAYIRELPDVPEDMKWFQRGSFGPEVSMRELGFTNAPVLAGTKKFKPDAYVNVPLEQLRVVQPSATKELVGRYIQDLPEEMPAFSYFEEGPWKGFSQMSGTHRLAAAKALGLEKLPVGVFAKAMKPSGSPFSQTKDMPVGISREMLQDIFGKDYLGYAKGGHVLEDDYPTHYLPEVGRQVMADGGEVYNALRLAREVGGPVQKESRAPYGVVDLGDKIIVGAPHGETIDLSDDLKRRVQDVANKHGAWYEGTGGDIEPNKNLIKDYRGSWDERHANSVKGYPMEYLGGMFSNVDVNKPHEKFEDPNRSIMESLIKNQDKMKYFKDRNYDEKTLKDFLRRGSQDDANLESMAQMPATKENLKKFFTTGEKLTWPDNWQEYPNKLGKIAKKVEDQRNQFLLDAPPGVYVTGAGHIPELQRLSSDLPVIGGERAAKANGGTVTGQRFAPIDPSMLIGQSPESYRGGEAYTDAGGLSVAAPFVTGMRGGYPTFDFTPREKPDVPALPGGKNPFEDLLQFNFLSKLLGRAEGGAVRHGYATDGSVEFAPPEVEQALKTAQEVADQPRPFTEAAPKKEYEPFGVLPLKETEEGISFDPYAGILGSITRPAKYFYETMTGQKPMEPTSEEAIKSAMDIAGALTTGAFGATKPAGALTMGAARPGVEKAVDVARERALSPQGLYSHAAEVAANLPQAKGSYEQMMAMLQKAGVKPEEMRWSGVEQFAGQPVTREQLSQHFEQNLPKIEETYLSDVGRPHQFGTPEEQEAALNRYHSAKDKFWKAQYGSPEYDELANEFKFAESALKDIVPGWGRAEGKTTEPTKFAQYTIPGGENYREVLLGLEAPRIWQNGSPVTAEDLATPFGRESVQRSAAFVNTPYQSSHWDQPNVLGHLRMSDRTGPEGEKILHLEELQSDWGQAGRKKGFALGPGKLPEGYTVEEIPKRPYEGGPQTGVEYAVFDPTKRQVGLYAPTREEAINSAIGGQYGVPAAPYVTETKHWVDLGLKRALKEAAEGGYDKMVWTPGAEQAARYDLSKQVNKIEVPMVHSDGARSVRIDPVSGSPFKLMIDKSGKVEGVGSASSQFSGKTLDEVVGKEIADKIMAADKPMSLEGEGLKIGGEGMKGFYDKIVPTRLKELVKKLDPEAKIELGSHDLPQGHGDVPVKGHVLHITPKMREAILKGLPAYKHGGSIVDHALDVARSLK